MRRYNCIVCLAFALGAAALVTGGPLAAQPAPLGPEELVFTEDGILLIDCPVVAGRDDGSFLVAFSPRIESTSRLLTRAYDASGDPFGEARVLDGSQRDRQIVEELVTTASGYTIQWRRGNGSGARLLARLDPEGELIGRPIEVGRTSMTLVPRPEGGFVAVWTGRGGVNVQLLDDSRRPLQPAFRVAKTVADADVFPSVEMLPGGGFVVLWSSRTVVDGQIVEQGLRARVFGANGRPRGRTFLVIPPAEPGINTTRTAVAIGPDGTLAVAWSLFGNFEWAGVGLVSLRTFDLRTGRPLGPTVAITTEEQAPLEESFPEDLAFDEEGRIFLVWSQYSNSVAPEVRARLFDRTGAPLGKVFEITTDASDPNEAVSCVDVAIAGDTWVVSWIGTSVPIDVPETTQGVYVRRFERD